MKKRNINPVFRMILSSEERKAQKEYDATWLNKLPNHLRREVKQTIKKDYINEY